MLTVFRGGFRGFQVAIALPALLLVIACGSDPEEAPVAATPRPEAVAAPELSEDEVERLQALGYVEVVSEEHRDLAVGARTIDPARTQAGLNFYVNARLCSAELMTAEGEVLRSWSHEPCSRWGNAILTSSGDVLAIHRRPGESAEEVFEARELLKLAWDGELLWSRQFAAHHDVDVMPDGRIATLTYRYRVLPEFDATIPVRDHSITILSPEGQVVEEASVVEILGRSPAFPGFLRRKPREHDGKLEIDLIHPNSIEWMRDLELARSSSLYVPTNFLLCSRSQDSVMIIDWKSKQVVWSWGPGIISGPHDATLLSNGNILVFDNGLRRQRSRVVEVDPRTNEMVWSYQGPESAKFFTTHRGASQRLPNGNTLITDSGAGRVFEVTSEGDIVWTFVNPNRNADGERSVIVRARRIQRTGESGPGFEWSD